jgi:hypothetical protein
MKTLLSVLLSLPLLVALAAGEARAQERSLLFGASGGVTFPIGDLADDVETGFHINGILHTDRLGGLPFGLRGEAGYQSFSHDDDTLRHLIARVNAIVPVWERPDAVPYIIAGVGLYNSKAETDHGDHAHGGESENFAGINAGFGVRWSIGGLQTIVEARFHHVFDDQHAQQFIPFSIGVLF